MPVAREHQLYVKIAQHLQENYPDVIYRFDIAADLKLTQGQAKKFKTLHPKRGYPDLFIAKPKVILSTNSNAYTLNGEQVEIKYGFYLELKAEGNSPFKKDGTLKKDQHLEEQNEYLERLRKVGYKAEFATGLEEAVTMIDNYLQGKA